MKGLNSYLLTALLLKNIKGLQKSVVNAKPWGNFFFPLRSNVPDNRKKIIAFTDGYAVFQRNWNTDSIFERYGLSKNVDTTERKKV